jgi:hypothetical protein
MTIEEWRMRMIADKAVAGLPPNKSIPRLVTLLLSWADLLEQYGVDVDGPDGLLETMEFEQEEIIPRKMRWS